MILEFPDAYAEFSEAEGKIADLGVWIDNVWQWEISSRVRWRSADCQKQIKDKFVWWQDQAGLSVSTCYAKVSKALNAGIHLAAEVQAEMDMLWKIEVPSRIRVFGLRMFQNRLPTKQELKRRVVISGSHNLVCPFCFADIETIEHLFVSCSLAVQCWDGIVDWLEMEVPVMESSLAAHSSVFPKNLDSRQNWRTVLAGLLLGIVAAEEWDSLPRGLKMWMLLLGMLCSCLGTWFESNHWGYGSCAWTDWIVNPVFCLAKDHNL